MHDLGGSVDPGSITGAGRRCLLTEPNGPGFCFVWLCDSALQHATREWISAASAARSQQPGSLCAERRRTWPRHRRSVFDGRHYTMPVGWLSKFIPLQRYGILSAKMVINIAASVMAAPVSYHFHARARPKSHSSIRVRPTRSRMERDTRSALHGYVP